jgi:hypothetical protein
MDSPRRDRREKDAVPAECMAPVRSKTGSVAEFADYTMKAE